MKWFQQWGRKMIVKILLGIIAVLILIVLFGCTEPAKISEPINCVSDVNTINILESNLAVSNIKIIKLQENNEYLRKKSENMEEKQVELQEYYNKLFGDAVNCYWANDCLYYQDACVDHFKDAYVDWTAEEIHILNSDQCETMIRDWGAYLELQTSGVE